MADEVNLDGLLEDLDAELSRLGIRYRIIACGGFVLQRRYYVDPDSRKTGDLDSLTPLDEQIQVAAGKVGQTRLAGLGADVVFRWLNDRDREGLHLDDKLPTDGRPGALKSAPSSRVRMASWLSIRSLSLR